ncbi:MAG: hypothetical protein AB7G25_04010 [Sphingomonadaceae bacterium]
MIDHVAGIALNAFHGNVIIACIAELIDNMIHAIYGYIVGFKPRETDAPPIIDGAAKIDNVECSGVAGPAKFYELA